MNISKTISKTSIDALNPGDIIRDTTLRGFGARYRKNTITYFVQTRINHQQRYISIGVHGSPWTPDTARKRATSILIAAKQGLDPVKHRDKDLSLTFKDIFTRFMKDREPSLKPNTAKEYKRVSKTILEPHYGKKPFATLDHSDVAKLHRSMSDRPGAANHALTLQKTIFFWAKAERYWAGEENPCLAVTPYKRPSCARFLSIDDLTRLSEAFRWALSTGAASQIQLSAILLLLFTGSRKTEMFTIQRKWIDRHRMLAYLPDSKTMDKVIHLNEQAIAILDGIAEVEGNPYYFPGRKAGKPISGVRRPWDKIRARAKLEGFRLHDFRHSFASFAADGGASAQAVGAVLGHASIETTKIYMHLFNGRAKETATATAARMQAIMSSAPDIAPPLTAPAPSFPPR